MKRSGNNMNQNESYGKRMWRVWSPLLIKFGISYVVYLAMTSIFMMLYLIQENALDAYAMNEILADQGKMQELMTILMEQLYNYAVPIEGLAAGITIPLMAFFMYRDRKREKEQGAMPVKKAGLFNFVWVILISAALCVGLNNLILLGNLPAASDSYGEALEMFYNPSFVVQILCLGILSPVCEELVYRGLMFQRLRQYGSFVYAALYSTVIFAVGHGNMVQMLYGFIMGMVFAYMYERYGSIAAPIVGHVTANIFSVIGTQFLWFDWMMEDVMRVGVVTVLCAAAASSAYVMIQRVKVE